MIGTSRNLWSSDSGKAAIRRIVSRTQEYWATHVYNYYRRHTGKLGRSCDVIFTNGLFTVNMIPMLDVNTGMDYGRSIRHGISAGPGEYDPEIGKRRHVGWYPGVSVNKFWTPWMNEFHPVFRDIVREEINNAVTLYLKLEVKFA